MENSKNTIAYRLPEWEKFEKMVEGIWEREYYTNHGPLAIELEAKLEKLLGVKHVVCMTNASIALMIAIKALETQGTVLVPAFSHINIAQSVYWAGLTPVYSDVEAAKPVLDLSQLEKSLAKDTGLVIAINPLGDAANIDGLTQFCADKKLRLAFVSDDAFGQQYKGKSFGNFGDLEIFSFREMQLVNGADGACVCTSDDLVAAKLRNIRSSYGAGKAVPISYTGNGRMSEIQAGLILLSLEDRQKNIESNQKCYALVKALALKQGVSLVEANNNISDFSFTKTVLKFNDQDQKQAFRNLLDKLNIRSELFDFYVNDDAAKNGAYALLLKQQLLSVNNNQVFSFDQLEKAASQLHQ